MGAAILSLSGWQQCGSIEGASRLPIVVEYNAAFGAAGKVAIVFKYNPFHLVTLHSK